MLNLKNYIIIDRIIIYTYYIYQICSIVVRYIIIMFSLQY